MKTLLRRVKQLEQFVEASRASTGNDSGESAFETILEILRVNGVEQRRDESLGDCFARYLGMTSRQLQDRLTELAYGRSGVAA